MKTTKIYNNEIKTISFISNNYITDDYTFYLKIPDLSKKNTYLFENSGALFMQNNKIINNHPLHYLYFNYKNNKQIPVFKKRN